MVERCLAKADIAGPNPVSRSMPRYRKIARLFTSVIRTRVDRGNPRIPSSHMTCCCRTVRFFVYVIRVKIDTITLEKRKI